MSISYDVSISDYHASPLVSHSKLADFVSRGPRYYATQYVQRTARPAHDESDDDESDDDRSDALIVGQAFEDLLCSAKSFDETYAVKPRAMKFSTKEGKAWRAEMQMAHRTILTESAYGHIVEMVAAIEENETARKLIRAALQQPTIRWEHPGLPGLQARPDFYNPDGLPISDYRPYTVDLKSTSILTRISSGRSVADYGYHRQAALVGRGLAAHDVDGCVHYLLAVEKCRPHRAQVLELAPGWILDGNRWCDTHLERLSSYYARGEWPRVEQEIITLYTPAWMHVSDNDQHDDSDDDAAAAE